MYSPLPEQIGDWQEWISEWRQYNFPEATADQQLFGVVEEVGELCHAHLKGQQKIRHTADEAIDLKCDAVGDILVYLASFCDLEEIDMVQCWNNAMATIAKRDWQKSKTGETV